MTLQLKTVDELSYDDIFRMEKDIVARTIYGEARGLDTSAMEAVANIILNRLLMTERSYEQSQTYLWWGESFINICHKPHQFSCWNRSAPTYKKLMRAHERLKEFEYCLYLAEEVIFRVLPDNTNGATHYHHYAVEPYWAKQERPTAHVDPLILYKLL